MYDLIDSHCHLDFEVFDHDRDRVIARAHETGVCALVVPGVSVTNWQKIDRICIQHDTLYACYGIHPYNVNEHGPDDINKLEQWLGSHPHVAVGECGLDYRDGQAHHAQQMEFFGAQLDVALKLNKPVVIHSVRATEQVIQTLKKRAGLCGMVHSYSGSYQQACQLIDMGFYISLGGAVTYDSANRLRETAKKIPLENLLLETDAPDQPAASHHGHRNEPAFLLDALNTIADLRQESAQRIAEQTSANAKRLFGI